MGMMESPCFMAWPDMARRAVVLGLASMNLPRLCQACAMASQPVGTYIYIGSTSYRNLYLEHIEIIEANQLKFSWWIQIGKNYKKGREYHMDIEKLSIICHITTTQTFITAGSKLHHHH
jgi:hypothetical protein